MIWKSCGRALYEYFRLGVALSQFNYTVTSMKAVYSRRASDLTTFNASPCHTTCSLLTNDGHFAPMMKGFELQASRQRGGPTLAARSDLKPRRDVTSVTLISAAGSWMAFSIPSIPLVRANAHGDDRNTWVAWSKESTDRYTYCIATQITREQSAWRSQKSSGQYIIQRSLGSAG